MKNEGNELFGSKKNVKNTWELLKVMYSREQKILVVNVISKFG
jgi:hypothetical protein